MRAIDIIKRFPKAAYGYLKAVHDAISKSLEESSQSPTFEDIYNRLSICRECNARCNDTCMACGCNCFIKSELDGSCPIWNAIAVSKIEEGYAKIHHKNITLYHKDGSNEDYDVEYSDEMKRNPFIIYIDKDDVTKTPKTLILEYKRL